MVEGFPFQGPQSPWGVMCGCGRSFPVFLPQALGVWSTQWAAGPAERTPAAHGKWVQPARGLSCLSLQFRSGTHAGPASLQEAPWSLEPGILRNSRWGVVCGPVSHHPDPSGPAGTPFQALPGSSSAALGRAPGPLSQSLPLSVPEDTQSPELQTLECGKIFYHSWHCHSASWDPGSVPMGFPRRGQHCHSTMGGTECYETVASAVWGFGELGAPALL